VSEPQFNDAPGGSGLSGDIFHMAYDPRDGGAIFAAINSVIWGSEVRSSVDLGKTWKSSSEGLRPSEGDATVSKVWHVEPGRADEPGVAYAGVEPAALFKSEDGGDTWGEIGGLTSHPTREQWQPGLGGLCLHSIVLDPSRRDRMWVGISAVGVFGTDDGGRSWRPMNQGLRADFLPDPFPEVGQCPHKMLAHGATPDVLFQQNHCGVFRTDSGGDGWQDITNDLPSRFGMVLGGPLDGPEHDLCGAGGQGDGRRGGRRHAHSHRRQVQGLSKPQRRQRLGAAHQGAAPEERLPSRHARGDGNGWPGPLRSLHRYQHRSALLQPRRRLGAAPGLSPSDQLGGLRRGGIALRRRRALRG